MVMVRKIILKDRSDWLQHRSGRIGGSEASAIVGLNPYQTNVDLWELKTGRIEPFDISDKPYVKYGTEAEQFQRELFKLDYPQYKVGYEENNMFLNDDLPFAHASLDGWLRDQDGRLGVWECKTTNILQRSQKEKWSDKIPDNYYIQCLHYLMVTGFDFVKLRAQLKWEGSGEVYCQIRHYHIERSEVEEDIAYLLEAEKDFFYENIIRDKRPNLILPGI